MGTDGRGDNWRLHGKPLFNQMVAAVRRVIEQEWHLDWTQVDLVSGGSAWVEHTAVELFLQRPVVMGPSGPVGHAGPPAAPSSTTLTLHTPVAFVADRYVDTPTAHWTMRTAGQSMNFQHRWFIKAAQVDSMVQIAQALSMTGASMTVHPTFEARNAALAASDRVIALTLADSTFTHPAWPLCTSKAAEYIASVAL
jgi:hypothetical protein